MSMATVLKMNAGRARPPRRVLVTGGSGFLGQHLVRALSSLGSEVTIVDLVVEPTLPGRHVCADVRHWCAARQDRFDLVVHLAAHVGGRASIEGEPMKVAQNSGIDAAVFEYVAATRPTRMVYMSSSAVYPVSRQAHDQIEPLEEHEVAIRTGPIALPDQTYGWSKVMGEYLSIVLFEATGVPVSVFRPFSVYGPGQSRDYPVSAIAARAAKKEDPLIVWGSGEQTRDFVYVGDFVDTVLATYGELDPGEPLNISSGFGTSFRQVAQIAAEIVGYRPVILGDAGRPAGVERRVGTCPERVQPHLTTSLVDGVRSVIDSLSPSM